MNILPSIRAALSFVLLAGFALVPYAQTTSADDYWENWKEDDVSSFPDYNLDWAIQIESMPGSQLNWFIDPQTVTIGQDSVVRYVVIASNKSGAFNAFCEGLLCSQASYKTYARIIGQGEWRPVENAEWRKLSSLPAFSHEKVIASNYICDGAARPTDVRTVIENLREPYYQNRTR